LGKKEKEELSKCALQPHPKKDSSVLFWEDNMSPGLGEGVVKAL